jgi:hypothetical protein
VHPVILQKYLRSAAVINLPVKRHTTTVGTTAHSPEEDALIEFLDEHFPERRKERRVEE